MLESARPCPGRRAVASSRPAHVIDRGLVPALGWLRQFEPGRTRRHRSQSQPSSSQFLPPARALDSYARFADVPNYWWPDDSAWCLSSDTDFFWSYLAGTRARVDEILAIPVMDAIETALENPAHQGMDTINGLEGGVRRS